MTADHIQAVKDAVWPLALERLKHTEPHPDQGIACVGSDDLALALERLHQFADVAMGNALEVSRLLAALAQARRQIAERDAALRKIGDAAEKCETKFGGSMSEVTRVFQNITRVARLHQTMENELPACPQCGAPSGRDCRTIQGRIPPHEARIPIKEP